MGSGSCQEPGCQSTIVVDPEGYCVNHTSDPEIRARVEAGRKRGGENARRQRGPLNDLPPPPRSYSDAVEWLAWLATVTASGAISSSRANALRGIIDKLVDTLEPAQEEQDLAGKLAAAEATYVEHFGRDAADKYPHVFRLFLDWRAERYPESTPYWRTPTAAKQWSEYLKILPEMDTRRESEEEYIERVRRELGLEDPT